MLSNQVERMDTLISTTNHRLDDYRKEMDRIREEEVTRRVHLAESLIAYQRTTFDAIAQKANRSDVVLDVFRGNKAVQAGLVAFALVLTPVVADHWRMLYERIAGLGFF